MDEINDHLYNEGGSKIYIEAGFLLDENDQWKGVRLRDFLPEEVANDPALAAVYLEIESDQNLDRWNEKEEMQDYSIWFIPESTLIRQGGRILDILTGWDDIKEEILIMILRRDDSNHPSIERWIGKIRDKTDNPVDQAPDLDTIAHRICAHLHSFDPAHSRGRDTINRFHGRGD